VPPEIFTIGHGRKAADELVACLHEAAVETLVDVRRYPFSRRNPQFNQPALEATVRKAGIDYVHAVELGGLREDEPGEELFGCLGQFASYAARISGVRRSAGKIERPKSFPIERSGVLAT